MSEKRSLIGDNWIERWDLGVLDVESAGAAVVTTATSAADSEAAVEDPTGDDRQRKETNRERERGRCVRKDNNARN